METDKKLGERIRAARKAAGLSQSQFAEALNTTQSGISLYEGGLRGISIPMVQLMSRSLDRPVSWFLADSDGPDDPNYVIPKDSRAGRLVRFVEARPEVAAQLFAYGRFLQAEHQFGTMEEPPQPADRVWPARTTKV